MKPFLVSIDGPDGSGKSSLSVILKDFIESRNNYYSDVSIIKPTYFEMTKEAALIGSKLKKSNFEIDSLEHNSIFLEAMRVNYQHLVIPSLKKGKMVILDSSEIRALAFVLDRKNDEAILDTKDKIISDFLTLGITPNIRIFLDGSEYDLFCNLQTKQFLDSGDPKNIFEISERRKAYFYAINFISNLEKRKNVVYYNFDVKHRIDFKDCFVNNICSKIDLIMQDNLII